MSKECLYSWDLKNMWVTYNNLNTHIYGYYIAENTRVLKYENYDFYVRLYKVHTFD